MGINWRKVGQFIVDVGIDSLDSSAKSTEKAIKNNLKKQNLTEEQRKILEEKLNSAENLKYRMQDIKDNYHS